MKTIGTKFLVTTLIYSGSVHGWLYADFHKYCDGKSPTITLYQIKDGDCIGGYTKAQWSSDGTPKIDSNTFLFNATTHSQFPTKNNGEKYDIYCGNSNGPDFGDSAWELRAMEPFNGERNCISLSNQNVFSVPLKNGINCLTNQEDRKFTITELEVWLVSEHKD